jgi:hypothetical protein
LGDVGPPVRRTAIDQSRDWILTSDNPVSKIRTKKVSERAWFDDMWKDDYLHIWDLV